MSNQQPKSRLKPGPKPGTPPPHVALRQELDETNQRLDRLERLIGNILPASMRALSTDQVAAAIAEDQMIFLEVLEDYKVPGTSTIWKPGHRLRPCDYAHLMDLVSDGLKLGVPEGNAEIVQELLDQAQAHDEAAAASARAAEAAAAEARAAADAGQAGVDADQAAETQEHAEKISA